MAEAKAKQEKPKPDSLCIWYDQDNEKYYKLNNNTGEMKRVNKTGEYIKRFNPELTGSCTYHERIQKANGNQGFMPFEAKSLKYSTSTALYTPQIDKLEEYAQFPNPRTMPYYNQSCLKLSKKTLKNIENQEQNLVLNEAHNQTLFSYKGIKKSSVGTSYLTSTITAQEDAAKHNKIRVLRERSIAHELADVKEGVTKNINGRDIQNPNTKTLMKSMQKANSTSYFSRMFPNTIREPQDDENQLMKKTQQHLSQTSFQTTTRIPGSQPSLSSTQGKIQDERINIHRFTEKVRSVDEKIYSFSSIKKLEQDQLTNYFSNEGTQDKDIDNMTKRLDSFNLKTFDKTIKLNILKQSSNLNQEVINRDTFTKMLQRERQELAGFKMPEKKEKETVVTKGRFQNVIPSSKTQYDKDHDMILKNFSDLYVEKENPKKKEMEMHRRELLKKVISEMLINNEKNKL